MKSYVDEFMSDANNRRVYDEEKHCMDVRVAEVTALRLARDEIARRRRSMNRECKRLRRLPKQDHMTDFHVERSIGDQRGLDTAEKILNKRIARLLRLMETK